MTHKTLPFLLAFSLVACSGDTDGEDPTDTPTTPTGATGETGLTTDGSDLPPWQVIGQEGSIRVRLTGRAKDHTEVVYELGGMFVSQMQGFIDGEWCYVHGVCFGSLPTAEGEFVDGGGDWAPKQPKYSWNGNWIYVGSTPMVFQVDQIDQKEVGYYSRSVDEFPEYEPIPLEVEMIGGHWGDWSSELPLPTVPEVTDPAVNTEVQLGQPVTLTWTATGEAPMYLRVDAANLDRLYYVEDDGQFQLDPTGLGLPPGTNVELFLGRWVVEEVDVNGNLLRLISIAEQPLSATIVDP